MGYYIPNPTKPSLQKSQLTGVLMPNYEYFCKNCNAIDELDRPMKHANSPTNCPECDMEMTRHYSGHPPNVVTKGCEIPYLHPAFGTIMTDTQAKAEAKRRGLIEVGNEDVSKHTPAPEHKSYEADDYFL